MQREKMRMEEGCTRGVARLCGGSGGCRNGDSARDSLEVAMGPWYNGNEGVEALDILAWPKEDCCAIFSM